MEIMLSHLGIGVAYDALDGLNVHAQRLHLRHIGQKSLDFFRLRAGLIWF